MKRIAIVLALILTICTTAYAAPIYKYEEVTPISDSITLTKVREFYSDYNISYSYIKADLTNENTSLKLLKSNQGTDILDTVGNLAKTDENTVAAMNADFFSVHSGNKGFSLGIEIKDGSLIQSPINPSTMATISYIDNKVDMSYLDFHIMAVAPNGQYHEIRHLNKHTTYYGHILMYTKDFNGGMSPAPGGNVVEVVVENNKIVEFRRNMPPVQIPENGCVLVTSEGATMFLANNFNVGDEIRFDYYITPAIYNVETAFGGGAMLVSNGQAVTNYSHVIAGNNPRSAIGVDKSGSTLYLVAVDGRQDSSIGMRMSTLANLMISLGCYNAVNLDGGGSTNMVASTTWDENLHTVNSPTENRKVINAVGLAYTAEASEPAGILLKNEKDVTFIGQPVNISAVIHDKNLRPVSGGEITWTSQYGNAVNGVFTPSVGGNAVVSAAYGNAVGSTEIYVVDTVTGIDVDSHIQLNPGETSNLNINAFDADGHYVNITNTAPFEISSSNSAVVSVNGKTLTAHTDGTAIISVKIDGAASYTSVVVGGAAQRYTDNFETPSGNFKSYPSYVQGNFALSNEQAYSGKSSGKLSYDFTAETEDTKGAYFNLTNKPQINNSSNTISVWFYTGNDFNHELRAQFTDGNGKLSIISFGKSYKKGAWQQLTATIPDTAVRPLTLDSIYALYMPGDVRDSGSIYIDDLTYDLTGTSKFAAAQPNVYATSNEASDRKLTIGALVSNADTLVSKLANSRISNAYHTALIGNISKFKASENENALIISLDTSKGGIRTTDSTQWDSMSSAINGTSKKDVFILSDSSVFGSTEFETNVFHDYLASLDKNVFVITPGQRDTLKITDGVHYFTLGNKSDEKLDITHLKNYTYLEFSFGNKTTFEWKSYY